MKEDQAEMKKIMTALVIEEKKEKKLLKFTRSLILSFFFLRSIFPNIRVTGRKILIIFVLSICRKFLLCARVAYIVRSIAQKTIHKVELKFPTDNNSLSSSKWICTSIPFSHATPSCSVRSIAISFFFPFLHAFSSLYCYSIIFSFRS